MASFDNPEDARATAQKITDIFAATLKKDVPFDEWRCTSQTCVAVDASEAAAKHVWQCTTAVPGAEDLVGRTSGFCAPSEEATARTVGKARMVELVHSFVERGAPVEFVLPAFPYKSRNHVVKTSGELPDMGEALSIARLGHFAGSVTAIYPPGAHITIVSDGHVFNDIAGVSDCALNAYTETIRGMIAHYGQGRVSWAGLDTFLTAQDLQAAKAATGAAELPVLKRRALEFFLKEGDRDVDARIRADEDYKKLYLGFLQFKTVDFGDMLRHHARKNPGGGEHAGFSNRAEARFLGAIAKKQMVRNQAYNRLLEARLRCGPAKDLECVRLSIHPHPNNVKFGVNLVLGQDASSDWPTPWHNVVLMPEGFRPLAATADGYPEVVDSTGSPLRVQALEKRWTAEHEHEASPVSLPVASPRGSDGARALREHAKVASPTTPSSPCEDLDAEMPFWVCTARRNGYRGTAEYVSSCGAAESGTDGLVPVVRPFYFQ